MRRLLFFRITSLVNSSKISTNQQNNNNIPKLHSLAVYKNSTQIRLFGNSSDNKMADQMEKAQTAVPGGDTIFGKITRGEIPTDFLYKDDKCVAFKDISPVAPVHILIVPIQPITQISEATEADKELLGHLLLVAKKVAEEQKLERGYRLVINNGKEGQQSVYHLHIHLIGGKQLSWPPC